MKRSVALAVLGVLVLGLVLGGIGGLPGARAAGAGNPVQGSVQGPSVLATLGTAHLTVSASGGPAFAPNGTLMGNLTYYSSVTGANLTGVSVVPSTGAFVLGKNATPVLSVGATPERLTVTFEISSVLGTQNQSTNVTYTVRVVQPYVLTAVIVNSGATTVLPFTVDVRLDGTVVGNVTVPTITPHGEYNLSFPYATAGLAGGDHTFSISLANAQGLVTFANGATSYSVTFYVAGAAPDNTVWYVLGGVAFVGVLFIFATRVAARRRGAVRK